VRKLFTGILISLSLNFSETSHKTKAGAYSGENGRQYDHC